MTVAEQFVDLLRSSLPDDSRVFFGKVETDRNGSVATSLLPYFVVYDISPETVTYRLSGRSRRRIYEFQITAVAQSASNASRLAARARDAVEGARIDGGLVRHAQAVSWNSGDLDARTTDNKVIFPVGNRYSVSV